MSILILHTSFCKPYTSTVFGTQQASVKKKAKNVQERNFSNSTKTRTAISQVQVVHFSRLSLWYTLQYTKITQTSLFSSKAYLKV